MTIRKANYKDAPFIKLLLNTTGHRVSISHLVEQIETLFGTNSDELYLCELQQGMIIGFASVHYFPLLASNGNIALINIFFMEEPTNNMSAAQALEEYIINEARKRKCVRVQLLGNDDHLKEHNFCLQQGYQLTTNLYTKHLT